MAKKTEKHEGPRILNRRGRHDYHILQVVECGIELFGTEVKSLRNGQAKIDEAYARVRGGEAFLVGAEIALYPQAAAGLQHAPTRERRLLLHRRQIAELEQHGRVKGQTIIPLAVYFRKGWAKCELGLAVGMKHYDKRDALRKRDQQ
jgi:SsrA-binding protein